VVSLFPHPASFRFHLAVDTLAFGYTLPATGRVRDFHPSETCTAGRTWNTTEAGHHAWLPFFQKVRPQKEETPWLLTSPVSFSPALHIGQLWEEQLT